VIREPGYYWVRHKDQSLPFISKCYVYSSPEGGYSRIIWTEHNSEDCFEDEEIVVLSKRIEFPLKAFL